MVLGPTPPPQSPDDRRTPRPLHGLATSAGTDEHSPARRESEAGSSTGRPWTGQPPSSCDQQDFPRDGTFRAESTLGVPGCRSTTPTIERSPTNSPFAGALQVPRRVSNMRFVDDDTRPRRTTNAEIQGGRRSVSFNSRSPASSPGFRRRASSIRGSRDQRRSVESVITEQRLRGRTIFAASREFEALSAEDYMRRVLSDLGSLRGPFTEGQYLSYWRFFQECYEDDGTGDVDLIAMDEHVKANPEKAPWLRLGGRGDLMKLRHKMQRDGVLDGRATLAEVLQWTHSPTSDASLEDISADLMRLAKHGRLIRSCYRPPRPSLWRIARAKDVARRLSMRGSISQRPTSAESSSSDAALVCVEPPDDPGTGQLRRRVTALLSEGQLPVSPTSAKASLEEARNAAESALAACLLQAGVEPGAPLPPDSVPDSDRAQLQLGLLETVAAVLRPAAARRRLTDGDGVLARVMLHIGARRAVLQDAEGALTSYDEARRLSRGGPLNVRCRACLAGAAAACGMRSRAAAEWQAVIDELQQLQTQRGLCAADEVLLHHCQVALANEILDQGEVAEALQLFSAARDAVLRPASAPPPRSSRRGSSESGDTRDPYHAAGAWCQMAVLQAEEGMALALEKGEDSLKALRLCRSMQRSAASADPRRACALQLQLGRLYAVQQMPQAAAESLRSAVSTAREHALGAATEMRARMALGDVLRQQELQEEARNEYECALGMARQLHDERAQAWGLLRSGLCSARLQLIKEKDKLLKDDAVWEGQRAFTALTQAVMAMEQVGAPPQHRARACRALAELFARSGNYLQAAEQYDGEEALLMGDNDELGAQRARDAAEKMRRLIEKPQPKRGRGKKKD
eukprot:TRINITY_DN59978_c0_g1_i1.p1 TRINITY_DN59978_c0_g1~~TRINITY_DN59978_c0_g1_i1.p1  ORF type:complete len:882 (+),score=292.95 TRINITY_DN59978_c0_g1_i1:72-2648(+)